MLLKEFIAQATASLRHLYPENEARSIVLMLCGSLLGVKSYTHIIEPATEVPASKEAALNAALERLVSAEPVQYVTGEAFFCDLRFKVTPDVLIPRPETELLVREACNAAEALQKLRIAYGEGSRPLRILDLCTGSGCIAWSMAVNVPGAQVVGVDVSEKALAVALGQDLSKELKRAKAKAPAFFRADLLDLSQDLDCGEFDLLLANPPYVLESQKAEMRPNVLDHEPGLALFVPDEDPLVFYRAIAHWTRKCLKPWGKGIVEINDVLGAETRKLFEYEGFGCSVLSKDLSNRPRFVTFSR